MSNTYHAVILTDTPNLGSVKPIGSYAIANYLRLHGYNVLVIEHLSIIPKETLFKILNKVITNDTLFVGYSSTFFLKPNEKTILTGTLYAKRDNPCLPITFNYFNEINSYIKELNPLTKVVFGGSNGGLMVETQIKNGHTHNIDYVIFGNAEQMILDFVENINHNVVQNTSNIINGVGIIDYDKKGEHFSFKNTKHTWHESDSVIPKESLMIEIARGCVFKCKFCAYPLIGKNIKDDSYIRSENIILEEIRTNYEKFQTTYYVVADDTFNERTDKIELLLRVRDKSKLDLTFAGYNRVDLIARKPEQISLLNELNFNGMFFGIESMNHQAAKHIGKGCKPEEITETLHKLRDVFGKKLLMAAGFIIGLPYDNPLTVEEWTRIILQKDYPLDHIQFSTLSLDSNANNSSIFFREKEKYNFQKIENFSAPHMWKNDTWDYIICDSLATKYRNEAHKLDKNLSGFAAMGLMKYGYTWDELITLKNSIIREDHSLIEKHQTYINKYLQKLENFVFQN
jgi:radical SAM superfamily enzyme YgiQ (UPF0313 family)